MFLEKFWLDYARTSQNISRNIYIFEMTFDEPANTAFLTLNLDSSSNFNHFGGIYAITGTANMQDIENKKILLYKNVPGNFLRK